MSGIELYSTTAANNNSAPPNGWPENQTPSSVNDCARQMMASIRDWYETAEWINLGHVPTYVSGTSFTVPTDLTTTYQVGRRMKLVGTTPFIRYAIIATSTYSAPNTTVTLTMDSGTIDSSISAISVGIISITNKSITLNNISGYGTMATQNANTVAITGGSIAGVALTGSTINNSVIGGTTPVGATFNALTVNNTSAGNAISALFSKNASSTISTGITMFFNPSSNIAKQSGFAMFNDGTDNIPISIYTSSTSGSQLYRGQFGPNGGLLMGSPTGTTNDGDVNITGDYKKNGVALSNPLKAWVKFSVSGGACTITAASTNISSVTYNAVGTYTVNFSPSMTDANYCVAGMVSSATSNTWLIDTGTAPTTSACKVNLRTVNSSLVDPTNNTAMLTFTGN